MDRKIARLYKKLVSMDEDFYKKSKLFIKTIIEKYTKEEILMEIPPIYYDGESSSRIVDFEITQKGEIEFHIENEDNEKYIVIYDTLHTNSYPIYEVFSTFVYDKMFRHYF